MGRPGGLPPTFRCQGGISSLMGREVLRVTSRLWRWLGGCEGRQGETPSYPLQGAVGLEAAIVQVCVSGLLAGSSADVHVQHELQAFHYLRGQRVGPGHWVQDMVREGVSWGPPPSLQAWALVPTGGGKGRPQSPGLGP